MSIAKRNELLKKFLAEAEAFGDVLKIKLVHKEAKMPTKAHESDVGYDVYAATDGEPVFETDLVQGVEYLKYFEYDTGISVEPPVGMHVEVLPRSSLSNYSLVLANHVGVIDPNYRGTIKLRFRPAFTLTKSGQVVIGKLYKAGDAIGQLVMRETWYVPVVQATELSETDRGEKGFGSSDAKPQPPPNVKIRDGGE